MATVQYKPDDENFPLFKDLPPIEGAPEGAAWFWGKDDELGRLNLLTPTRVLAAKEEIKFGDMTPMNLPLDEPSPTLFGRFGFKHTIKKLADFAFDDLYEMNTQSGTQWDGFRHFGHIGTCSFYNGLKAPEIQGGDNVTFRDGIHNFHDHGIAARGVFFDYTKYCEEKGIEYGIDEHHSIPLSALVEIGKQYGFDARPASQGGDIKPGDILLVRSGFIKKWAKLDEAERSRIAANHHEGNWPGLEQTDEMRAWLHDCYFAAVAGDAPSFECWPTKQKWFLHEYLLALWGVPIGEMFDLEGVATRSAKYKRLTLFMTSCPANAKGGVGSHANALAIF